MVYTIKTAVIGSINIDLSYQISQKPKTGETLIGNNYQLLNGGKGANQAVILNNEIPDIQFLGAVGDDQFADIAIKNLQQKGLETKHILQKSSKTGFANIEIYNGDNSIIVFPGANYSIDKTDIDRFLKNNNDLKWIIIQFEIPIEVIKYIINKAYENNIGIILNPAPAQKLSKDLLDKVTYLIPNESEFNLMFPSFTFEQGIKEYGDKLIITLGDKGVLYNNNGNAKLEPAHSINVVDTTGAGDSFVAGFSAQIIKGKSLKEAVEYGNSLAAKTCQCFGAQCLIKDRD